MEPDTVRILNVTRYHGDILVSTEVVFGQYGPGRFDASSLLFITMFYDELKQKYPNQVYHYIERLLADPNKRHLVNLLYE